MTSELDISLGTYLNGKENERKNKQLGPYKTKKNSALKMKVSAEWKNSLLNEEDICTSYI